MTTSRMNKLVSNYYIEKDKNALTPMQSEKVDLNYDKLKRVNGFCKSTYKSFFTVPVIIYTFSKERIHCDLNPKLIGKQLQIELDELLKQEYYKLKLNGMKMEIQFVALPNSIEHKYVSHVIPITGRYYTTNFSVTKVSFKSDTGNVVINVNLKNEAGEIIKTYTVEKQFEPVFIETLNEGRRKFFIYNGLNIFNGRYNELFKQLSKEITDKL